MNPALSESDPLAIATAVASEVVAQPDLFGPAAFSDSDLAIVRAARAGRYTGSRTRDEARVAVVVALRSQGCSLRDIERRTGMDPRLVAVVVREAEQRRAIPAIKEALNRRLAETTERALDRLDDELSRQDPDPALLRALGVAVGIGADKVAGTSAAAGDLHLHQHVHLAGADPAREYLKARAAALATESDAVGKVAESGQNAGDSAAAAGLAASRHAAPGPGGAVVDLEPAGADLPDPGADPRGGVASRPGAAVSQ